MDQLVFDNAGKGYPLPHLSVKLMQDAILTSFEAAIKSTHTISDPTDIVILQGALVSVNVQDYTVTDGFAFYQNEIFEIDAGNFTAPGGEVGVFVLDAVGTNLGHNDNNTYKANETRKLKFQTGLSGSGIKDHDQVIRPRRVENDQIFDFTMPENTASTAKLKVTPNFLNSDQNISGEIVFSSYNQATGNHSVEHLIFQVHRHFVDDYAGFVRSLGVSASGAASGTFVSAAVSAVNGEITLNFATGDNGTATTTKFQGYIKSLKSHQAIGIAVSTL